MLFKWSGIGGVLTGQDVGDFFVDDNIDFHSALRCSKQHSIESVLFILAGRSTQI